MPELNLYAPSLQKVRVHRTEKFWVHTDTGRHLDILMGNAAFMFGYDNDVIKHKMRLVQDKIAFLNWKSNETCEESDHLTARLCELGGYDSIAWAVSGSDGVEAAYRINELYWQRVDRRRTKVVSFFPCYHGATYLARSFRSPSPSSTTIALQGIDWSRVADRERQESLALDRLEACLSQRTDVGAVIFETLPWVSGIKIWTKSWWTTIRNICNDYNVNLILDDCLGCAGKVGPYFSQDRFGIKADIVVLGKSITGGFSPLSGACVTESISAVVRDRFDYGHTWQPNMAGVGAAIAVLDLYKEIDVYNIEVQLERLGELLLRDQLIVEYQVQGTAFNIISKRAIDSGVLYQHGMIGSLDASTLDPDRERGHSQIAIFAPLIADGEYFMELESRLRRSLSSLAPTQRK